MSKVLNKKTGIAAGIIAVIVIAAVVISTTVSNGTSLEEAKEIAQKYVPKTAKFVTSEEEENKFEVMFHDDENREGFEVEVAKDTKKVKKVESQLDNDLGSKTVKLTEKEVKEIIKKEFAGVSSVTVTLNKDNGLYEYEASFKAKDFYGDADVHPENGSILDSTVKYGTAVTIPVDGSSKSGEKDNNGLLTYEEAKAAALKAAGAGFIKDIDLDKENGMYFYDIELIKDNMEYDYYVDAKTGEVMLENQHESYFDYDDRDDYDDIHDDDYDRVSGSAGQNQNANSGNSGNGSSSSSGTAAKDNLISESEAKNIVLAKVPGASFTEFSLDYDDGRYVYEGEAYKDGYEYSFEINASSGVIIDWEKESMEDDD